jgi:hypothetical protein
MSLMASRLREEIYTAIRTFTCAKVAEAEEAARAIIRFVENESAGPKGPTYNGLSLDALARSESYHPGDDA